MTTTTQNPASFSRFSRFTFGLGLKSTTASSSRARENEPDDQWYIPYTGPVEPPREPIRRASERDSWGDPIEMDGEEDDATPDNVELRRLYTGGNSRHSHAGDAQVSGGGGDGSMAGHRARVQSGVSGRVRSSSRASVVTQRQPIITPSRRPAALHVSGGVGESPMPPTYRQISSKEGNRSSIAGFFSFPGPRVRTPSEKGPMLFARRLAKSGQSSFATASKAGHRRSSSTGSNSLMGRSSLAADADEYYNHYYFSTDASHNTRSNGTNGHPYGSVVHQEEGTPSSASAADARHPYSYVFPTSQEDTGPRSAPLPPSNPIASGAKHTGTPKFTFTEPQEPLQPASANGAQTQFPRSFPFQIKQMKNSASTPDLRISTSGSPSQRPPAKVSSKIKTRDRWLAAETWCDALLFPRPRLKMKTPGNESDVARIVSLPPSPMQRTQLEQTTLRGVSKQGVVSRVLAHSRSLADLGTAQVDPVKQTPNAEPGPSAIPSGMQLQQRGPGLAPSHYTGRAQRPKSWALDDLDLPTPVPSLAHVVEEAEKFDDQRRKWQDQATNSFQNRLTRSISRNRSKSLTQKGRRNDESRPSNINFLAARAYLGNQLQVPVIAEYKLSNSQVESSGVGPSKPLHSHSNSLAKTWSKSHSRGHSRSDSFGRAVLKKARPAARGEFPTDNELENALRGGDTKVIRLADPALERNPTPLTSSSPTPPGSLISDARIGIALTTPPLVDNIVDAEAMRLPTHPYAQGGLFSLKSPQAKEEEDAEVPNFLVPSPENNRVAQLKVDNTLPFDFTSHDGPTKVSYHPYAHQASSRSSFIRDPNFTYSDIPAPSKMWAQLSPGVIREVLPNDIQYSPFMSENGEELDHSNRNSRMIYDTVGVGEALAYAVQPKSSQDSDFNPAEGHAVAHAQVSSMAHKRSYRQAVQYDTSRPPHLLLHEKRVDPYSAHTFASSPLLHQQQTPGPEVPRPDSYDIPTTNTSPESLSPPHSPRLFGDPDDLEGFYDLFYNPNRPSRRIVSEASYTSASGTPLGSRRGGSMLASLARQLSEEFEQTTLEHEDSQYIHSFTDELQGTTARRPTGSTLEFVFEETSSPGSATTGLSPPGQSTISPFQPSSENIPEDVESSRSSSEPDNDEAAGPVGPVYVVDGDNSYIGQMSSPTNQEAHAEEAQEISSQPRINSGLQPPSADPTRSSYLTTSSMSRMSGLSDFPAPPPRHAAEHMSILTSYFEEAHSLSEVQVLHNNTPPSIPFDDDDVDSFDGRNVRLTIDGEEELEELVAALSSHSHSTVRH